MSQLLLTCTIAGFFYLVIPGTGAFLTRRRWRRFRQAVLTADEAPRLRYSDLTAPQPHWYRMHGRLEAIQEDHRIWVGDPTVSVICDLRAVPVFVLPSSRVDTDSLPDETPRLTYWKDLTAIPEGTPTYVAGRVEDQEGTLCFVPDAEGSPLVIVHDGREEDVPRRAMWTGRQRNEYWNHLTPISLVAGFVSLTLWGVIIFGMSRLQAIIALVFALLPILPLFPPGVFGFYWYRRLWRGARRIRAERDLALASQGHSGTERREYRFRRHESHRALRRELAAVACLLVGLGVNGYLVAAATALMLR